MKSFIWRIFQNSGLIIISLGLIYGGVLLMQTGIPFWSLFYGLTAVFLGIVMSLIAFNEMTKNQGQGQVLHSISCKVCGRQALTSVVNSQIVCTDCQYKMAVRLHLAALIFLAMLALPATYHLAQQAQQLQQQAKSVLPSPLCESGSWDPALCRCGTWIEDKICAHNARARDCLGQIYCCRQTDNGNTCK